MIPVSAPVRARDRLRRAPDGPVRIVHRGPDAVYLALDDGCLGVTGAGAVAVPCALHSRVARFDVRTAAVRAGVLHLDGEPLAVRRLVDTRVPSLPALPAGAPPAPARMSAVGLPTAVTPDTAGDLVGRGEGLTPLGDDVLCGWLALHRAAGADTTTVDVAVRAHLHRTTLLSATLLRCALDGEVIPRFAAFVAALGSPAEPAAEAALAGVGHSSGTGMAYGARLALAVLRPGPPGLPVPDRSEGVAA
ncbi:DUF2877 domain-containing protein [Pseudonocardia nantongensis]|uniref:DUF2877 domain-containing protein n=1 Tax=Pseudonocardia nantongensis TaxID=1181885 RepID=UPI0039793D61